MLNRLVIITTVAAISVLVLPNEGALAAANLVVNGNFETGDLTGWSNPNYQWAVGQNEALDNFAAMGIANLGYQGHLTQNLNLISGQKYHMSFDYSGGYIYGASLNAKIGGREIGNILAYHRPFNKNYFHSTFIADEGSLLDLNAGGYGSFFYLDNVSVSLFERPLAVKATNAELARMSSNAYHDETFRLPGVFALQSEYTIGTASSGNSLFAETYISNEQSGEGDQIVVAIRGSKYLQDWVFRNGTFVSGEATAAFSAAATEVAMLIGEIHEANPNASITLTGHSMGGAIAQAIGQATGIGVVAFDAPGANGTFNANDREQLYALAMGSSDSPLKSPDNNLVNIRYFGDEVSKIGEAYSVPMTVMPLTQTETDRILRSQLLGGWCAYACHNMDGLALALEEGRQPTDLILDFYDLRPSPLIFGAADTAQRLKNFNYSVNPFAKYLFDPDGNGNIIELDMADSDVNLVQLILPGLADSYPVWVLNGDQWELIGNFDGFDNVPVPASRFYRIGNALSLTTEQGAFAVGMEFDRAGTFRGSLRMLGLSAVPEPKIWAQLIFGFFMLGTLVRVRNRKSNAIH